MCFYSFWMDRSDPNSRSSQHPHSTGVRNLDQEQQPNNQTALQPRYASKHSYDKLTNDWRPASKPKEQRFDNMRRRSSLPHMEMITGTVHTIAGKKGALSRLLVLTFGNSALITATITSFQGISPGSNLGSCVRSQTAGSSRYSAFRQLHFLSA
ncbi:uncharacterized protein BO97DRAFT_195472 [Aspergillus homomorphus CBS 101889]|uniref:Uncharacterized protein n=1 Tax=Aspergillus homomorphus (strain CBS 101889) TaxID=1450537 RepID=A0A395HNC0_ASPHC|nr:hypothetical protein BO97DRAFT_195472 [Aspergillus homomorphus CBS 101889]RAL08775.1 hypothetical protein BO97DRAFT_195472 [Aspergillus homomorphus CBS 101889]